MKFLHTADLHLDSAFSLVGQTDAEAKRERQREVLRKIFDVAIEERCDMMLIAGDLFDSAFVTPETKKLCLSLFERFSSPIIIAPGNHDPYIGGSFYKDAPLPKNVYVFTSSELQFFDFPELDTTVAGYAFTSPAFPANPLGAPLPVRHNQRIFLLCAHTELDSPTSRYAPVFTSDITRAGFDYAALGHVHRIPSDKGNIRYCGIPEGRGFDEIGEGGVLLVETDGVSAPRVEMRRIAEVRYICEELSVDGASESSQVEQAVERRLEQLSGDGKIAVRLELVGAVAPEALDRLCETQAKPREEVISLEIVDSTLSIPDSGYLEKDTTLRGEFYRSMLPELRSEDPKRRATALRALRIGLAAIEGKSFTDGGRA